jgi:DnaA family protein
MAQLALPVNLQDEATLANFAEVGRAGGEAVAALNRLLADSSEPALYLFGPPGCGRSHLLQAACHRAVDLNVGCAYLPLAMAVADLDPDCLQGLESLGLLALDELDAVATKPDWEQALFHLYNRCTETGCRLLLAANRPATDLGLTLPDLSSRLGWGLALRLQAPDDSDKQAILMQRAVARGFDLPPEVIRFILQRAPRDMNSLMTLLDDLDRASLSQGRLLTIPFVKTALGW